MTSVPAPTHVNLGSVFRLCSSTVLFGFAPFWVVSATIRWGLYPDTRHRVLSLLSSSAAGVLLAHCMLDVVPAYLREMTKTFSDLGVTLCFPVPEFILAMGFLLLLLIEQALLAQREQHDNHTEKKSAVPVGCGLGSNDQARCSRTVQAWPEPSGGRGSEDHARDVSLSAVRAFVLVLSLCLCSVLDSGALVQRQGGGRGPDLLLCNGLVSFSLALKLAQSQLRQVVLAASVLLFSAMAPLGVVLGGALRQTPPVPQYQLARATLQGLAAGSFSYIIFMEVLPHVLNTRGQRIPRATLLLTGFSAITAVLFIKLSLE
ncbi:zinc transporter ZIP1-like [Electrophorus electricus]|uniref:Solute carrier family 39 member 1 n=1 Tax=Electrophorus electricus TaxID=8005 RepID=A0A4W4EFL9_ELEEL|nr:zinc transporter ZIP1-like [Electrophorus electricus]XP_026861725.2 zinc transporter ZIP1-like [Electrophorus electricus]XP_026861726.2 zinc transporter ZIP1-like [Electrophorus electricus]XP_026861727.2 zinc transporter ZIP1-like [Electrophorus electricus]